MAWRRASFKGKDVWVQVGPDGQPAVSGGRVPMRYSDKQGARIYRAGASRVSLHDGPSIELSDGVSADDAPARGRSRKGSGFGRAGTRSAAQTALAADAARQLLDELPEDAVRVFTDGACRGNPGPAGSGALVVLPDGRHLEGWLALGRATNNVGELSAVGLALDLLQEAGVEPSTPIAMLSDSSYTHGVLFKGWKAKANRELILELRERLKAWPGLSFHWVAGHAGIQGNERADALANRGVDGGSGTAWRE